MDAALFKKLICIKCLNPKLDLEDKSLVCSLCQNKVPVHEGIPDFLSSVYIGRIGWRESEADPLAYESIIEKTNPYRLERIDIPLIKYARGEVLEIGCGTCRLAEAVQKQGGLYYGLDPAMTYLSFARDVRQLQKLICGQGECLPFHAQSFDSIISGFYAFSFVNPELGLPEAHRVLKKGGKFVFDLLNHWLLKLMDLKLFIKTWDWQKLRTFSFKPSDDIFEFINLSQFERKVKNSGFSIEDIFSVPVTSIFPALNRYIDHLYFRGPRMILLGYDIIIVLKAI